jgi:uracil-DNA glycosylase
MSVQFLEKRYSWEEMTLWNFLEEGNIPTSWSQFFIDNQDILYTISKQLHKERPERIYPDVNHVFRAFIPLNKIRVVVLGQDPYHDSSAVGYCFSVLPGNNINPSLRNIYKELKSEGYDVKQDGILTHWVNQGCFMLNTALTVERGCADSHTAIWYDFTEKTIKYVADNCKDIVWLLMGSKAHRFKKFVPKEHLIICTSHPSPFSAHKSSNGIPAFLSSGAFMQINAHLKKYGQKQIKW